MGIDRPRRRLASLPWETSRLFSRRLLFLEKGVPMNQMKNIVIEGQEAFCATCPAPEEVTHVLEALAFRLTFHMPALATRWWLQWQRTVQAGRGVA